MAWNEGTMSQSAGALLAILDTYLVANSYWSVYDSAAGTNAKVYRNYDAGNNVDYYVKVDDNYANYGGYGIAVSNHRFIFIKLTDGQAYYIGQLKRFDTSKNMPCAIVNTGSGNTNNPIGYYNSSSSCGWACLFDEARLLSSMELRKKPWGNLKVQVGFILLMLVSQMGKQ